MKRAEAAGPPRRFLSAAGDDAPAAPTPSAASRVVSQSVERLRRRGKGQGRACRRSRDRVNPHAVAWRHDRLQYRSIGCISAPTGGMHLLFWKTIQEGLTSGQTVLDLGRTDTDNDGLATFKDRWGAVRSQMTYWRYPAPTQASALRTLVVTGAKRVLPLCQIAVAARQDDCSTSMQAEGAQMIRRTVGFVAYAALTAVASMHTLRALNAYSLSDPTASASCAHASVECGSDSSQSTDDLRIRSNVDRSWLRDQLVSGLPSSPRSTRTHYRTRLRLFRQSPEQLRSGSADLFSSTACGPRVPR